MQEIGLFPLPLVLFPGEALPLHIFEPRYRELIGECIDEDDRFALVLEQDGVRRDVATSAAVEQVLERFDDGRLNIVVRGEERLQLGEETAGRSFRTAAARPLPDEADPPSPEAVDACLAAFAELARAAGTAIEAGDLPDAATPALSYALAERVAFDVGPRQELLELRSERLRVELLTRLLADATTALLWQTTVRERARGNGHAARPDS